MDKLTSKYDMIISRNLLKHLEINYLFDTQMMEWDIASTPMQNLDQLNQEDTLAKLENKLLYVYDPDATEAERIHEILDAKYCKTDLDKLTQECEQLSKEKQQNLLTFLKWFEQLFDGTVGTWNTDPVDLLLRDPNCTPCYAKPYLVPQSQEKKYREEVKRLYK